ncbi:rhodanese-like domain-containing protein [Acidobacteriota bacterium]
MKKIAFVMALVWIGCLSCFAEPVKNVSSEEAFEMVRQPDTFLIDVRSVAEYVFVGHPEMAYNIPLMFWNETGANMESNSEFVQDLEGRFQKSARLIFICRSGGRSASAARMAQKAGFTEVFNIEKGFEGEKNSDGYRTVNGWKNSRLPYTYSLKSKLRYTRRK